MDLKTFIETAGGDREAADLLGFNPRTVKAWRLGANKPTPVNARQIVERTKAFRGRRVTMAEIYQ